ncbi:hypothetical protein [Pyrococcus kukulkanii]|uniref:Uncharacterized protein n=1 Tax=Pyrococcus kukulkanii TaxID=1609559 RepID=A0A127BBK5_9EURY|nr:hypothetical protein [Pyrococcus kukulkanii]AMM54179.1 hypothetical protein TQ32_06590 [Pyrococcus kukulkanii]
MPEVEAQTQTKIETSKRKTEYDLEVVVPHRKLVLAGSLLAKAMPPVAVLSPEDVEEMARKMKRTSRTVLAALRYSGLVLLLRKDGKKHWIYLKGMDVDTMKRVLSKKAKSLNPWAKKVLEYSQEEIHRMAEEKGVSVRKLLANLKEDYLVIRLKYPREIKYVIFKGVKLSEALKALEEFTRVLNGQPPEEVKN